ncbi:MAG: hypothetical protein WBZ50_09125 [Nitrososphaeraceae archaeon]
MPEHEQDIPHHTMWNRSDEDNKFTTTAGLAVSVATSTPTLTPPFTISLESILKLDHHSTSLING